MARTGKTHSAPKELSLERRRELVAKYRVQHKTYAEISELMAEEGAVNKQGKPFSLNTISNDVRVIRKEWKAQYADHYEEMQQNHILEVEALKRELWKTKNHRDLIKLLEHEARLLHLTDSTTNIQVNNNNLQANALPAIDIIDV